jgi:hypothetical protein
MSKNLLNLNTNCRMILDEVSEADWTDSQINVEINYAYMEMYTAVVETYEDYYRKVVTGPLFASRQDYLIPTDMYKLRRLEIKFYTGDSYIKVTPTSFDQNNYAIDTTLYTNTNRPVYDLSGDYIRILPLPPTDTTGRMRLIYITTIAELSANDDTVNIPFPDRFAQYIVLGACAKLLKKGQQEEAVARGYNEEFQIGIEKMKNELENRYADGAKMISDTLQQNNNFATPNRENNSF